MTEKELIQGCLKQDRKAQQLLYDQLSPKMLAVCRRYIKSPDNAEDVMIEGFFKAFTRIEQFNDAGSFEGWIRRIMVNESLMFLRKQKPIDLAYEPREGDASVTINVQDTLEAEDILNLLAKLPKGYRTIFNLYVIEGYKHREIAEQLNISINTSKSQLILAKKRMRELLIASNHPGVRATDSM